MSLRSQGTMVYFVNPEATLPTVIKLKCPTGVSGLGGAKDQIDDTCLEATIDRSFTAGLGNPGQVSIPFILDTADASHQDLFDLKESGVMLNWNVALADGTSPPTWATSVLTPPTGRSSIGFKGYISDVNIDIAGNDVVRGTLTVQRSGAVTLTPKA